MRNSKPLIFCEDDIIDLIKLDIYKELRDLKDGLKKFKGEMNDKIDDIFKKMAVIEKPQSEEK